MTISKRIILVIVIAGVVILAVFLNTYNNPDWHQFLAKRNIKKIIAALNTKDAAGIKAIFSEKALEDAYNMDEGVEYLFSLYQGTCEEYEEDAVASGTENLDTSEVQLGYILTIDGKKNKLIYHQCLRNRKGRKYVGVTYLKMKLIQNGEKKKKPAPIMAGIYNPVWDDYYINEWSSADSEKVSELKEMIQKDDAIGVVLQGSQYNRIEDLYSDISTQLRFPQTATNLDEFCDEMEDLSWLKQEKIIILLYTVPNMLEDDKNAYKEFANEFRGIMKKWEGHPRDNRADQILARSIDLYMVSSRESGVGG